MRWADLWAAILDRGGYDFMTDDKIVDKYSNPALQNALNIKAAEIWDAERINIVFIEEAAEAIQSVIHFRRGKCGIKDLFGEMADLQIMLDQMKVICGQYEFDSVLAGKYAVLDLKLDNIECVFGSGGGGLVMICRECGRQHMRGAYQVLEMGHKEYCVWCGKVELKPVIKEVIV